ncbi:MAG: hypothetical protein M5R36_27490 [Deltaproteobacteria bacterium]|nr:hypothetical protein [Deltaproteobacteria bacterium]
MRTGREIHRRVGDDVAGGQGVKPLLDGQTARAKRAFYLSAFVFPGAGQIYTGRRNLGIVFVAGTAVGLILLLYFFATGMSAYFNAYMNIIDPKADAVQNPASILGRTALKTLAFGILPTLILWIVSGVEAHRFYRSAERRAKR